MQFLVSEKIENIREKNVSISAIKSLSTIAPYHHAA
jgi:hypothetical protein